MKGGLEVEGQLLEVPEEGDVQVAEARGVRGRGGSLGVIHHAHDLLHRAPALLVHHAELVEQEHLRDHELRHFGVAQLGQASCCV